MDLLTMYLLKNGGSGGSGGGIPLEFTNEDVNKALTVLLEEGNLKLGWTEKQDPLVSGTNIKTINNQSILGSGNITISGGSGGTVDGLTEEDVIDLLTELNIFYAVYYTDEEDNLDKILSDENDNILLW